MCINKHRPTIRRLTTKDLVIKQGNNEDSKLYKNQINCGKDLSMALYSQMM